MFAQLFSNPIWHYSLFGNTLQNLFFAVLSLPVFLGIFKIFQAIIINRLRTLAKKTKTDIDDTFVEVIQSLKPPFYFFISFYFALKFLVLPTLFDKFINIALVVWVVFQVIVAIQILINYSVKKLAPRKDKGTAHAIQAMGNVAKYLLWVLGILLILSNLGINITSLVAGLGIGGIAIALALQNILGDLFCSFAIHFDKPFTIGDFVIVEGQKGTVEKIGIKSTRIRSLNGEEIVMSNRKLTSATLQNFKKMKVRRAQFMFGVLYETPSTKLRKIPTLVKKIVKGVKRARFGRAHFKEFADSSLNFDVVYYVESRNYDTFMHVQQEINFKLKRALEIEKISMAYPTQTLYLHKETNP